MKQRLLPDILADIIAAMTFPITFTRSFDNGDGTFTLKGICDIHHAQPGGLSPTAPQITIGSYTYSINDYAKEGKIWNLIINSLGNPNPAPQTFYLYTPFFLNGTPLEQNAELGKIPIDIKTPLISLMEPYETQEDDSPMSSIGQRCEPLIVFLAQSDYENWLTKDYYHNAINPMERLRQDFLNAIAASNLFYTYKQKSKPLYFARFGKNIKDRGTDKYLFTEPLSGCSDMIKFEIYKTDECCSSGVGSFSNGFDEGFNT